jgi:hypothetical protein
MSVQLTIVVISALVSVASILLSARTTKSNTEFQAQLQRESDEFHARLQDELQQRRDQASKAARLEEVVGRYRDPLLSAAFELQSRIYNFVLRGFAGYLRVGDDDEKRYAVDSRLFVIAQYLAWTEALRRGVQFLDLGDVERSRQLADRLENIRATFSTDTNLRGPFRIFRNEQRAIGELMLEPTAAAQSGDVPWECMGFATICARLGEDETFTSWFIRLGQDIRAFPNSKESDRERVTVLQNYLMDLVDFLDSPPLRFPSKMRKRIPLPQDQGRTPA